MTGHNGNPATIETREQILGVMRLLNGGVTWPREVVTAALADALAALDRVPFIPEVAPHDGKALITVSHPIDDLWSNVFGSSFETWSWWSGVEYVNGATWQTPGADGTGLVRLTIEHPEQEEATLTKVIGVPELVAAWNQAVRECSTLGSNRDLDPEDLDASDGDCVLQIAVLGKTVFA